MALGVPVECCYSECRMFLNIMLRVGIRQTAFVKCIIKIAAEVPCQPSQNIFMH
jgi:hypothetical protein